MSDGPPLSDLLDVLSDEYARAILAETSVHPMSAKELGERCDASLPTIYRRIDRLQACGLLDERTQPQRDGNHYSVYAATLDRFVLELDDGEFAAEVEGHDEDPADRLTRLWEGL